MDEKRAYVLGRLALGISFLGHGVVRLPKLIGFSHWMETQFAKSMLPILVVKYFALILPFAELIAGLLIVLGLFTRLGLMLAGTICLILILGTTLIENWEAIPTQLLHVAFISALMAFINKNVFALDTLIKK